MIMAKTIRHHVMFIIVEMLRYVTPRIGHYLALIATASLSLLTLLLLLRALTAQSHCYAG